MYTRYLHFLHVWPFRWVHSHSSGHPDLLGGGGRLHRGGKAQAAEVRHQLLQTSAAGLQGKEEPILVSPRTYIFIQRAVNGNNQAVTLLWLSNEPTPWPQPARVITPPTPLQLLLHSSWPPPSPAGELCYVWARPANPSGQIWPFRSR